MSNGTVVEKAQRDSWVLCIAEAARGVSLLHKRYLHITRAVLLNDKLARWVRSQLFIVGHWYDFFVALVDQFSGLCHTKAVSLMM